MGASNIAKWMLQSPEPPRDLVVLPRTFMLVPDDDRQLISALTQSIKNMRGRDDGHALVAQATRMWLKVCRGRSAFAMTPEGKVAWLRAILLHLTAGLDDALPPYPRGSVTWLAPASVETWHRQLMAAVNGVTGDMGKSVAPLPEEDAEPQKPPRDWSDSTGYAVRRLLQQSATRGVSLFTIEIADTRGWRLTVLPPDPRGEENGRIRLRTDTAVFDLVLSTATFRAVAVHVLAAYVLELRAIDPALRTRLHRELALGVADLLTIANADPEAINATTAEGLAAGSPPLGRDDVATVLAALDLATLGDPRSQPGQLPLI